MQSAKTHATGPRGNRHNLRSKEELLTIAAIQREKAKLTLDALNAAQEKARKDASNISNSSSKSGDSDMNSANTIASSSSTKNTSGTKTTLSIGSKRSSRAPIQARQKRRLTTNDGAATPGPVDEHYICLTKSLSKQDTDMAISFVRNFVESTAEENEKFLKKLSGHAALARLAQIAGFREDLYARATDQLLAHGENLTLKWARNEGLMLVLGWLAFHFAHNVPIDDLDYVGIDQTFLVAA